MLQPYKRIFIMHLTVILGAGAAATMEQPVIALVVLIGLKILVDIFLISMSTRSYEPLDGRSELLLLNDL